MTKRGLGIFLLISFLCAQTELYQFLKAPLLVIHFMEHKSLNASFSCADFLVVHYFTKQVKDADYDRDMQLPFKSHSDKIFSVSPALIPERSVIQINFQIIERRSKPFLPISELLITQATLWHPPRISC